MNILVGTPSYGYAVSTAYALSLLKLQSHLRSRSEDVRLSFSFQSGTLISQARNTIASIVLNDPRLSYLLFVDADMGFEPSLVVKMLALGKPVVGSIAPQRYISLQEMHSAAVKHPADPSAAIARAQRFVPERNKIVSTERPSGERGIEIKGGCVQVKEGGTGIMLIERSVFESLRERYPELWLDHTPPGYADLGLTGGLLQCFDPMRDAETGLLLGEDVSFSRRWTEGCGGEIWCVVDEPISHVGPLEFKGTYIEKLRMGL